MIEVTKLNGERIIVNAEHIESVEAQPDTALVLLNGKRIVVREPVPDVVRRVVEYKRLILSGKALAGAGGIKGGRKGTAKPQKGSN